MLVALVALLPLLVNLSSPPPLPIAPPLTIPIPIAISTSLGAARIMNLIEHFSCSPATTTDAANSAADGGGVGGSCSWCTTTLTPRS
ncbi:hypothetical protein L873DRAFT_1820365 [Choiromyces venosus 120613-1]|uniref:Secreted peptide n=1 Tax=Choiromyces venosus 120613-1 TaxID=1336337 RepID=A0A3N4IXH6_9PEZI|nr:hypothetical protein L873DRAFT_1820365 [Choiromyces venosus 120613-1]